MNRLSVIRFALERGNSSTSTPAPAEERWHRQTTRVQLARALEAFNDPDRREEYFQIYDAFHSETAGGVEGMRALARVELRPKVDRRSAALSLAAYERGLTTASAKLY